MAGTYNYGQLEQLWQQAGGSARLAPTMAAIALAESGGRINATHTNSNGSVDRGLWQINSVHNYDAGQLLTNPLYNAKAAVSIERGSGLGAWSTYNSGAYKKYLGGARSSGPVIFADPSSSGQAKYVRTDQGVDITSPTPYTAVAAGRVVHIDPNFYNGTPAVYIKLDQPVTVNGRKYTGVYYAETRSLVRVGQHLTVGQDVIAGGNAEVGFAKKFGSSNSSWLPAAHGQYTEGTPTQAGADFLTAIGGKNNYLSGNISGPGSATAPAASLAQHIPGVVQAEAIGSFLGKLTSAAFWLRAAEVVGGGVLVLLGLYLLAKQIGLGDVGIPLPAAAKQSADDTANNTIGPPPRGERRPPRVVNQYYLEPPPTTTRRKQLSERSSDPATNEIPF